jgi:hypothetical protein
MLHQVGLPPTRFNGSFQPVSFKVEAAPQPASSMVAGKATSKMQAVQVFVYAFKRTWHQIADERHGNICLSAKGLILLGS